MIDVEKIRKEFPMLCGKSMQGHPLVYLDNGATTLKPRAVIDAVVDYYENYSANAHRGDYDLSYYVDKKYEETRKIVADFLHAKPEEIIYTSGASEGLNLVAYGYGRKFLQEGDIILTTHAEHASCILPWMKVAQENNALIEYVALDEEGRFDLEEFKAMMNTNVKVVAFAHVSNVLGYILPIKEICQIAHAYGAIVVVDGAQSVPHLSIDVQALDCDFLAFSAHKMCGPTGIGILYGKKSILDVMDPLLLGGDSNARYYVDGEIELKEVPYKFESGTQPIEAIFGLHAAISFLNEIGLDNIHAHEQALHAYAIEKLRKMKHIILYNANNDTGIITFNVKGVFAQDVASFFNYHGICIRSGQHCSKLLAKQLQSEATLRMSMYVYTSKEDVDKFLDVCEKATMEACLSIFF